jgi:hypothetical protein
MGQWLLAHWLPARLRLDFQQRACFHFLLGLHCLGQARLCRTGLGLFFLNLAFQARKNLALRHRRRQILNQSQTLNRDQGLSLARLLSPR